MYADSLMTIYDRNSAEWRSMLVNKLMDQGAFVQARRENEILLDQLDPDSQDYALAAFYESVLCDSLGLDAERMKWSVHYIQTALADAVFYNAKLRPWQISHHLIIIQEEYERKMQESSRKLSIFTWALVLLTAMLIVAIVALALANRKISRAHRDMEKVNQRLGRSSRSSPRSSSNSGTEKPTSC